MTDRQCIDHILRGHRLYWDLLGKLRGNKNHKGDVCWLSGDIYYAYSLQLNELDYNQQISSIIKRIENKELPNNITILPDSAPDDIDVLDIFMKTSHFKTAYTTLGMAKMLHNEVESPQPDRKLSISRINDMDQLKMSGAIFNAAFEYDLFSYGHYLDAYTMQEVGFYIAEYSGLPVGACMAISDNEAIEIAWVAVLTGYRKKGIAGHLLSTVEKDAMQNGKTISVLSASEGAINAYQRVGYKTYCKIDVINYISKL